ncbi:MAG: hypothetical protein ACO1OF_02895 [Adhaeribacter sp.]
MKANVKFILVLLLSSIVFSVNAQQNLTPTKKNTLFLELLGNGGLYSLNVDRIITSKEMWMLAGRLGISYFNHSDPAKKQYVVLPMELSYLRGKSKHFLEIGYGATMMVGKDESYTGEYATAIYNYMEALNTFRLGYRYQQKDGGMFYKVGWTPGYGSVMELGNAPSKKAKETYFKPYNFGLGVGYTFK